LDQTTTISPGERLARLALSLTEGVGPVLGRKLISAFSSAEAALEAGAEDLETQAGLPREAAVRLQVGLRRAEAELEALERLGGWVILWGEADYPEALSQIYGPPLALFGLGRLRAEDNRAVALVGSRQATDYGRRTTRQMAKDLAWFGATIVSGLAVGIDAAAHEGALKGGGRTIAVLGCGLDVDYPRENLKLKGLIAEQGAILTEFPLGSDPAAWRFPVRNRIIAGLVRGVVVGEASPSSGSLITARLALDFGRTVMAVPGPVSDRRREGTHQLIREGAVLVASGRDVVQELWPEALAGAEPRPLAAEPGQDLEPGLKAVFDLVEAAPRHADEIIRAAARPPEEILGRLLDLELRGLIRQLPGQLFVKS